MISGEWFSTKIWSISLLALILWQLMTATLTVFLPVYLVLFLCLLSLREGARVSTGEDVALGEPKLTV